MEYQIPPPVDPWDPAQFLLDPLFLPLLTTPSPKPCAPPAAIVTTEIRAAAQQAREVFVTEAARASSQLGPWDVRVRYDIAVFGKEGQLLEHRGTTDLAALLHPRMLPEGMRLFQSTWKGVERPVLVLMDGVIGDRLHKLQADAPPTESQPAPPLLQPAL